MEPRIDMYRNTLSVEVAGHLSAATKTVAAQLPVLTRELVKVRASQINGCSFCLDMHTKDAAHAGETEQRLHLVAAWREANVFSEPERAAIALAEQGTRIALGQSVSDDVWASAAKHFDEAQLVALITEIAVINAFNRICVITQQSGGDYQPGAFARA